MLTRQPQKRIVKELVEKPTDAKFLDAGALITRGFLTRRLTVLDSVIILKSINYHEFEEIKDWVPESNTRQQVFLHNLFYLSYSVFKVDGQNFLTNRVEKIPYLVDQFGRWPKPLMTAIIQLLEGFNNRYKVAMRDLKFWFAQEESRARWMASRGASLTDPSMTGIDGTQFLGLNELQSFWSFLNVLEDRRHTDYTIMSAARLAATAINPKGMRGVNAKSEAAHNKAEEYLKNLRRGVDGKGTQLGMPTTSPETTEELLEEVRKSQAGIKDEHDLIIEKYEQEIRNQLQDRSRELQQKSRRQVEVEGEILDPGTVNSSAPLQVTEEQMLEMLKKAKARIRNVDRSPISVDDDRMEKVLSMLGSGDRGLNVDPEATPEDILPGLSAVGYEKGENFLGDYQGPGSLKRKE